jgi:cytochrome c-type biogenesis protein CcmH/NrfG
MGFFLMATSLIILTLAAVLTAAAAFWGLRAYRAAGGANARAALIVCVAVAAATLGGYLWIGRPDLADGPYRARIDALMARLQATTEFDPAQYRADELLAVLHERARADNTDPMPHYFTGDLLYRMERPDEAARAFDQALRRDPNMAEAKLGLGRALVAIEGGRVSPEALALFQEAGATLNDPAPWMYQAMAAMQSGRDPRPLWREALSRTPEDDPRRSMISQMLANPDAMPEALPVTP